jgi:MoxR-like ATPase
MSERDDLLFYAGDGTTASARSVRLPADDDRLWHESPGGYVAERGLRDAVNVALLLGQPLLVTGEPGTGKTQLARSVAHELELPGPLVFNTKTTSTARDLFYRYDSLAHFHDAQFHHGDSASLSVEKYIAYEALGLAILLTRPPEEVRGLLPPGVAHERPTRSVVLVDEIDKAPRDLPNDVLNEIEEMSFTVRETGRSFAAQAGFRPVVIMTSNSEKNLPAAFLRRCVYYHIAFPGPERLAEIVRRRLRLDGPFSGALLERALQHFVEIRKLDKLRKKPATAELLAWLRVLERKGLDVADPARADELASTYAILAKDEADIELLRGARPGRRGGV